MEPTARTDALLVTDEGGTITHCVSMAEAILGHPQEALPGLPLSVLLAPDGDGPDAFLARLLDTWERGGQGGVWQVQARHRDGRLVPVLLAATSVRFGGRRAFAALLRDQGSVVQLDELLRRRDDLLVQARVNEVVRHARSEDDLIKGVLGELLALPELSDQRRGGVFLLATLPGSAERALRLAHAVGASDVPFLERGAWIPLGSCACGRAAALDQVQHAVVAEAAPCCAALGADTGSGGICALPLRGEGEVLGVLFLTTRTAAPLAEDRLVLLETVSGQVGQALRRLRLEAEMARLALEDALTGALNRRAILARLRQERARAVRGHQPLAIVMLDIDHFKQVNDSHGHLAGDAVIVEIVRRAQASVRRYDVVGRYGGEEFLLVLPEADLKAGILVAERIRAAIAAAPIRAEGKDLRVTASLGVAAAADPAVGDEALLAAADQALYEAKRGGRNRVIGGDEDNAPRAREG